MGTESMKTGLSRQSVHRYSPRVLPEGTQVLAGRYKLLSPLKRGGMGNLWTAEHLTLHSKVAIKLLDDELLARPEAITRFVREARAAAQIRSPHIVQILDVGVDQGIPFIAMELLQGETLAERLDRVGSLSPHDTARVLSQVARGLARAHAAGLVHRDLKPSNIFLERNDEEENVKVLDFGIAKALVPGFDTESGATRTGALIGSPHYMSPEQAEASETLDHRTDIWAMGVVAYECLTGRRPFEQASLGSQLLAICAWPMPVPSQVASVPVGFDDWFARACSRTADVRFASAHDTAHELRLVCEHPKRTSVPRMDNTQSVARRLPLSSESRRPVEPAPSTRPSWVMASGLRWGPWAAAALLLSLLAALLLHGRREPVPVAAPTLETPAPSKLQAEQEAQQAPRPSSAPAGTLPPTATPPSQAPLAATPGEQPAGLTPKSVPAKSIAQPKAKPKFAPRPVIPPAFKEDPY
jgi:serine/threonine-protein kinase